MRRADLRLRRMERGLTLQELARQAGLPVWALVHAETGSRAAWMPRHVRTRVAALLVLASERREQVPDG